MENGGGFCLTGGEAALDNYEVRNENYGFCSVYGEAFDATSESRLWSSDESGCKYKICFSVLINERTRDYGLKWNRSIQ